MTQALHTIEQLQKFNTGDAITFTEEGQIVEGEVIGVSEKLISVVYIAPNGEYSIDKFPPEKLSLKDEIHPLQETEEENPEEIEAKIEHIQGLKNTLHTLFLPTLSPAIAHTHTYNKIIHYKKSLIEQIGKLCNTEFTSIEQLSEEQIETLSENIDFMNDALFLAFLEHSFLKNTSKNLQSKEIQNRIKHFNSQAKKLLQKKIQKINHDIFQKRTPEEQKYPHPDKMMGIDPISDVQAKEQNINPHKKEVFNRLLQEETQKRKTQTKDFIQKLEEKRNNLLALLSSSSDTVTNEATEILENTIFTLAEETKHDTTDKAIAKMLREIPTQVSLEHTEITTIETLTKRMTEIISDISTDLGITAQYGSKEGFSSLLFSRITRIQEAKLLAKHFQTKYNTSPSAIEDAISKAIDTAGKLFIKNFTKLSEPMYHKEKEELGRPHIANTKSIQAVRTFFTTLQSVPTESFHNPETWEKTIQKEIAPLLQKILVAELKRGDTVQYIDSENTVHTATIQDISTNRPLNDAKYHITISYNNNTTEEQIIIITDPKTIKEMHNLSAPHNEFTQHITEHINKKNKDIFSDITALYSLYNTPQEHQKTKEEIDTMSFDEIQKYIHEKILNISTLQTLSKHSTPQTKPSTQTLIDSITIDAISTHLESFYREIQNLSLEQQLSQSAILQQKTRNILPQWTNALIHGNHILFSIALPFINAKYNLDIQHNTIKGHTLTDKYMHLYALAQNTIDDNTQKQEIMEILSHIFYTAKHIGLTPSHTDIKPVSPEEKNTNLAEIITPHTYPLHNEKSFSELALQAAPQAEELSRENIFTSSKALQIIDETK